jgi:16S rRNA (cytosine1402-N4)-methyltransferase
MNAQPHTPVLLREVLEVLAPKDGEVFVDGTFGAGGYSRALLDAAACRVFGIDRDPLAVALGNSLAKRYDGRLTVLAGRFGDMEQLLAGQNVRQVDGVALDLGVSSMQIDDGARGFSFTADGPLDMRMERRGTSATDLVNRLPEAELADIIHRFGEERHARRVARAIVAGRRIEAFSTTRQLAELVRRIVPRASDGLDPATRTFQALRIAVNDELGEVGRGLAAAECLLCAGGRLAVVSFHSLEDRAVKTFLKQRSGKASAPSRHQPSGPPPRAPSFRLLAKQPAQPGSAELAANPRARSARLRSAERTAAMAWSVSGGRI